MPFNGHRRPGNHAKSEEKLKALFLVPFSISFLIIGLLLVNIFAEEKNIDPIIGKKLSNFTLPSMIEGEDDFSYKDIQGRYVLINIFASWCVTCKIEHESLMQITERQNIPLYGIAWNDNRVNLHGWFKERGNPYKKIGIDNNSVVILDLGVTAVPESFLISPDGIIIYRHAGALDYESYVKNIKPLIK